jgi:exosortase C (VPDSG-CTERM-specific)
MRFRGFVGWTLILVAAFAGRLLDLFHFARASDLYSHILIIPAIALYLVALRAREVRAGSKSAWVPGVAFLAMGLGLVFLGRQTSQPADSIACSTLAFLALLAGGAFMFLGVEFVRSLAFPLGFLIFLAPFPSAVEHGIGVFFQHASAEAAAVMLKAAQVPLFREGMIFRIPGIVLEVAEECSGIRSSVVLFITSLVAGSVLLRRPWTRAVLTLAVIPLAIIRNGFRILTISLLCVHVGPEMIDSPIHHRGGPLFFVLSLIPFFGLLVLLRKREKARSPDAGTPR